MPEEVPHETHDKVMAWEIKAQKEIFDNEAVMGADGLGFNAAQLKLMVINGLKASIKGEYRSEAEAEELYFTWFPSDRKET